eukprot:5834201-Amphidinium_carterae.1
MSTQQMCLLRHFHKPEPENCAEQSDKFGLTWNSWGGHYYGEERKDQTVKRRSESSTPLGRRDWIPCRSTITLRALLYSPFGWS